MSVTKNPGGICEVHQAWILDDPEKSWHGSVFGLVDNDESLDITTSPVVSYFLPTDKSFVDVTTKSNSLYRVVSPDKEFIDTLLKLMNDK